MTSSSRPSTRELLIFCAAIFFLGDMTRFSLADEGLNSDGRDVNKMNEDPRLRGIALGVVGLGGSIVSTVEVRTMGVGMVDTREIGRMMTSSPSNVKAESREFNSVSALTASVLTITGKRTASKSLMYSEDTAKSLNSEDLECRSARNRMTVCSTVACPPTRSLLG
jgi:hypothetical protein